MNRFTSTWSRVTIQYRWLVIFATLLLVGLAPMSFHKLYFENSNEAYFVENDPNLTAFNNLLDNFGDTEFLVLGIEAREQDKDVFTYDAIKMINEITTFLEDHEHITQVRSLSKYQYTHDDDGLLATDDLFEDIDSLANDPALLDKAREIIAGEELALETLITTDFRHTRIAARVEYIKNENYHNVKLVSDLYSFLEQQAYNDQGFNLRLSGTPVMNERFETLTIEDQAILNPAMAIAMMIISFIVFRSIFATLIPLVVILSTMLFITSLQGILSFPNTAVTSGLVGTMIILSMGTCVHVLVEFFIARRQGASPIEAAKETNTDLLLPIFFTSLTTAIGFLALSVTELRPVREYAIIAASGAMIIFLLSTTTLPAVLSFIPWMPRAGKAKNNVDGDNNNKKPFDHFLSITLPLFTKNNRVTIGIVGLIITIFSLYSIQNIKVDSNNINYFKKSSWMSQDLIYFNDNFKGISNLEVIVNAGEEGGVKNPELLQRAEELQEWLESFEETGNAISLIDFYKQINQSLNSDNTDFFRLPSSREMAAQFLLLYENTGPEEDLTDLKDFNEQLLRISVPTINMDETEMTAWLNTVYAGIEKDFADLDLDLTGSIVMAHAQNYYTNNGMFQSFGIAILVIGLCFLFLFKSIKYGVIALLPSIVPIILTGGLVSYAGINIDLGTMIVGAMTIGIAVDDSIHVMSRYLLMRRKGATVDDAIKHALQTSGRAVIITSVILIVGFSCMLAGQFIPFIYVGLFAAMIMFFALIGDLFFMPALLYIFDLDEKEKSHEPKVNEAIENV